MGTPNAARGGGTSRQIIVNETSLFRVRSRQFCNLKPKASSEPFRVHHDHHDEPRATAACDSH